MIIELAPEKAQTTQILARNCVKVFCIFVPLSGVQFSFGKCLWASGVPVDSGESEFEDGVMGRLWQWITTLFGAFGQ